MNLKERIIADRKACPKDAAKRMSLGTILGELDRISKTPSDEQVIQVIKKMIEGNIETGKPEGLKENEIINVYLPNLMSKEELLAAISNFIVKNQITDIKKMSKVMQHLRENCAGRYDGKNVVGLVKTAIEMYGQMKEELDKPIN